MDVQELSAKVELLLKQQQYLLDRQAILDCLTAYCRGMDRMDTALTLSAYHLDAIDDHARIVADPVVFVEWANASHGQLACTHHIITNHSCELDGDTAHTETYWQAALKAKASEVVTFVGGRYIDRLERREGQWKIAARKLIVEWGGTPAAEPLAEEHRRFHNLGGHPARDQTDPSYERPLMIDPARIGFLAA